MIWLINMLDVSHVLQSHLTTKNKLTSMLLYLPLPESDVQINEYDTLL